MWSLGHKRSQFIVNDCLHREVQPIESSEWLELSERLKANDLAYKPQRYYSIDLKIPNFVVTLDIGRCADYSITLDYDDPRKPLSFPPSILDTGDFLDASMNDSCFTIPFIPQVELFEESERECERLSLYKRMKSLRRLRTDTNRPRSKESDLTFPLKAIDTQQVLDQLLTARAYIDQVYESECVSSIEANPSHLPIDNLMFSEAKADDSYVRAIVPPLKVNKEKQIYKNLPSINYRTIIEKYEDSLRDQSICEHLSSSDAAAARQGLLLWCAIDSLVETACVTRRTVDQVTPSTTFDPFLHGYTDPGLAERLSLETALRSFPFRRIKPFNDIKDSKDSYRKFPLDINRSVDKVGIIGQSPAKHTNPQRRMIREAGDETLFPHIPLPRTSNRLIPTSRQFDYTLYLKMRPLGSLGRPSLGGGAGKMSASDDLQAASVKRRKTEDMGMDQLLKFKLKPRPVRKAPSVVEAPRTLDVGDSSSKLVNSEPVATPAHVDPPSSQVQRPKTASRTVPPPLAEPSDQQQVNSTALQATSAAKTAGVEVGVVQPVTRAPPHTSTPAFRLEDAVDSFLDAVPVRLASAGSLAVNTAPPAPVGASVSVPKNEFTAPKAKPESLQGLTLLVSETVLECYPAIVADLSERNGIACVDCPLEAPVSIAVDGDTCLCLLSADSLRSDDAAVAAFLNSLQTQVEKWENIYIIVDSLPSTSGQRGLSSAAGDVVYEERLGRLREVAAQLAIPVQVREIRLPQALADLVYHLCLYNYRRFCSQHSNVAHQVYTDRPYLSSLTDIRFARECLFLQQLPSLNLFNCALLLSQFSLPSLLDQTADGVQRHCPCLSGRIIAATLQWLAYYSRAPQEER